MVFSHGIHEKHAIGTCLSTTPRTLTPIFHKTNSFPISCKLPVHCPNYTRTVPRTTHHVALWSLYGDHNDTVFATIHKNVTYCMKTYTSSSFWHLGSKNYQKDEYTVSNVELLDHTVIFEISKRTLYSAFCQN